MNSDFHVKMNGGDLEYEVQEKDNQYQLLRSKLNELEREVGMLRAKNEELQLRILLIERDRQANSEDKPSMVCEKQNTEREVEIWKHKYKELESSLLVLQESSGLDGKQLTSVKEKEKLVNVSKISAAVIQDGEVHSVNYKHVIQAMNLDGDETAPVTPVGAIPYSIGKGNEDDMSDCNEVYPFVATSRRKRPLNVVTSDSESDDDDNIPIAQLVRINNPQLVPQPAASDSDVSADCSPRKRKRLVKLSQKNGGQRTERTDKSENDDNDDDGDSMGDFIESSLDDSESEKEAFDDVAEVDYDSSDNFDCTPGRVSRTKDHGSKWEFQGDMQADIGKDGMLCMKAVCAIYRRQTYDEQVVQGTFKKNGRGFSTYDAVSGSELAEFLTDDNPDSDVVKSTEQLIEFDPEGIEKCRTLALKYANQLFDIQNNKEDPYFFRP